ncbi:hypothetical protein THAOC_28849 [Thalassiosira oceanica]|uniref:Uncharacterized protein n=1 Tax=Thalassiosira oceanica TaxID=159749 RepID=K0RFA4_THAOC|nr:hypothetical protein THAOC_32093 [Thalassiosira oceanica]EJK51935.1 hypothetical protein THAOC_28849 [Thalassiosira oceanica]|eukprot:EJK49067.1 hypothetical protein THAOC_32093 [Thalassiosira oceanica]
MNDEDKGRSMDKVAGGGVRQDPHGPSDERMSYERSASDWTAIAPERSGSEGSGGGGQTAEALNDDDDDDDDWAEGQGGRSTAGRPALPRRPRAVCCWRRNRRLVNRNGGEPQGRDVASDSAEEVARTEPREAADPARPREEERNTQGSGDAPTEGSPGAGLSSAQAAPSSHSQIDFAALR